MATQVPNALHIGINAYPQGNALSKCVADAKLVASLFNGATLLDKKATRKNIIKAVMTVLNAPGEWSIISYSGHGTQLDDDNKDEPDGIDEAIVSVELDVVRDDEIQMLLANRPKGKKVLLIADSCFSGTIQRAAPLFRASQHAALKRNGIRYLPAARTKPGKRKVVNIGPQPVDAGVVVASGCADFEVSYEGVKYGVLTGAFGEVYSPSLTIEQCFTKAAVIVAKSGYPQHPQLLGAKSLLRTKLSKVK